ncbi:MFS transporter [Mucilaginibacter sp. HMF5004]|uniref:MFS transporter n=1 Tax=Mucilaginibacter rivuli TaxID=2857527 RepID=UPI001C5E10A3|nr:MFS transporter [Mucilaginibacter rivuli]MBW4890379.1 MFS transporter [Mucilaginibacter rivuli]
MTTATTFSAFKSRNFRLYFSGQSVSLLGTWMQRTAASWIIYTLTHSTFILGLAAFAFLFPSFVLSVAGGVVSDRYNRYKVLLWTQVASMVQAIVLAAMILLNYYSVWGIIVLGIILGIINAFDVPARQSLVYEMVDDKNDLANALALNSSMVTLTRIIGPAIAGFVLVKFGDGICFALNALSFVAVIISLLQMRMPDYLSKPHPKKASEELKEGLAYLKQTPSIRYVLLMLTLISLFSLPFANLIPIYADQVFHGNAKTFGVIEGVIGLGSFGAAIFLASQKPGTNLKKILAINTLVLGAGLILLSHEANYLLFLVFCTMAGYGWMSQITISNTIVQTTVIPSMRGRVVSFYAMAVFGMMPLGGLLIGTVSHLIGTQNTILAEGIVALIIGLFHVRFLRLNKKKMQSLRQQVEMAHAMEIA